MLDIGGIRHPSRVLVAPMAGVTDRPFRDLCRRFGAHWLVGEMLTSDQSLWHSRKSQSRQVCADELGPRWIQIAGADPGMMAAAATANELAGAHMIDINMGCPAKKVCNKAAGSALLRDEHLVREILEQVTAAVTIPVTLKIRLGWSKEQQNAEAIAEIAQAAGISALTVHGRTRACKFEGTVDYDAIGRVKRAVSIPVIGNGDIKSPIHAKQVMGRTGVDAVMVGRAALGRPWLVSAIDRLLSDDGPVPLPSMAQRIEAVQQHLSALLDFYGVDHGCKIARKHVGWFLEANMKEGQALSREFNRLQSADEQRQMILRWSTMTTMECAA